MSTELQTKHNLPLKLFLAQTGMQSKLKELLGARASKFATSLVALQNGSPQLKACTSESIVGAALTSAGLNLEVDPNLGEAYLVPYGDKCSFQIGYRGLTQLALRSGQFRRLGWAVVYDGQLEAYDELEGELKYNPAAKRSDVVIGYAAKFTLVNSFERAVFWTKEACHSHGKRFSKSYSRSASPWVTSPDAMCLKTVLKDLLNHWAPKSIDMRDALSLDTKVFRDEKSENALTEGEIDVSSETVPTEQVSASSAPPANDSGAPQLSDAQKTLVGTCEGCSFEDFRTFASTLGHDLSSVGSYGEVPSAICESVLSDVKNLAKFIKAYRK